jgi:DNA invertase Pin-like site-specific DNA recombinase
LRYRYARVSTADQADALTQQKAALMAAGCGMIREEKQSGTSREGRDELKLLLDFARLGASLPIGPRRKPRMGGARRHAAVVTVARPI